MDFGSSEASSEAFFGRQVSPQRAAASFARLWAVQIMAHSALTLSMLPQESLGRHQDRSDQAVRTGTGDRRHHRATQERNVPHRCQAVEPGARETGAAGETTLHRFCVKAIQLRKGKVWTGAPAFGCDGNSPKAIQLFTARFSVALRFSWSRIDLSN